MEELVYFRGAGIEVGMIKPVYTEIVFDYFSPVYDPVQGVTWMIEEKQYVFRSLRMFAFKENAGEKVRVYGELDFIFSTYLDLLDSLEEKRKLTKEERQRYIESLDFDEKRKEFLEVILKLYGIDSPKLGLDYFVEKEGEKERYFLPCIVVDCYVESGKVVRKEEKTVIGRDARFLLDIALEQVEDLLFEEALSNHVKKDERNGNSGKHRIR